MDVHKSCFFIYIAISLSVVIGGSLPRWLPLSISLNALYGNNKNIQTVNECEKYINMVERFANAFQQMENQALENLRHSEHDFLSLPKIIPRQDIVNAMYQNIAELQDIYEDNTLIQPLCELIKKKCFPQDASTSVSFNSENVEEQKIKIKDIEQLARVDCVFDGKIEFRFTVLLEYLEGKTPYLTAFVYDITLFEDYVELAFKACLPLLEYPDPPEMKEENNELPL